jgi:hypothetical protein
LHTTTRELRSRRVFANDYYFIQIEVGHGKKAIAIFVPVPLLQGFHKIQQRYVFAKTTYP